MAVITLTLAHAKRANRKMRLDLDASKPHHRTILAEMHAGRAYEPDVSGALSRILSADDVFVDVGANVGFFTLLASLLVGANGRVVSFEAASTALAELRGHIALNQLANVTVVPKAASDEVGEATFYLNRDDVGGNALWDPLNFDGPMASTTPAEAT